MLAAREGRDHCKQKRRDLSRRFSFRELPAAELQWGIDAGAAFLQIKRGRSVVMA